MTSAMVAIVLGSLLLHPWLPSSVASVLVLAVVVLVLLREVGAIRLWLPQNARQVPQSIVHEDSRYGAAQFGFEMGTGVRTYVTSGLPHVLAAAVLLLASWQIGLLAGAGFGVGRAWMAMSRLWHGDVDDWDRALARQDRLIRTVLAVASTMVIAAIAVTLLTR